MNWSALLHSVPTLYFLGFFALKAKLLNTEMDIPAAMFFGVLLTACGWLGAKYDKKRW